MINPAVLAVLGWAGWWAESIFFHQNYITNKECITFMTSPKICPFDVYEPWEPWEPWLKKSWTKRTRTTSATATGRLSKIAQRESTASSTQPVPFLLDRVLKLLIFRKWLLEWRRSSWFQTRLPIKKRYVTKTVLFIPRFSSYVTQRPWMVSYRQKGGGSGVVFQV